LTITELQHIKDKALDWANQMEVCVLLNNNESLNAFGLHEIEFALAAGAKNACVGTNQDDFETLKTFRNNHKNEYCFGFFTYDLKNQIEDLSSNNFDGIQFPSLYFFVPEHVFIINKNGEIIFKSNLYNNVDDWLESIDKYKQFSIATSRKTVLKQRVSKEIYLENIEKIKEHIIAGDVYEMNFCMEFFDDDSAIDPIEIYKQLQKASPVPFGSFVKYFDKYLACASPERFILKKEEKLFSQPIKGTIKRNLTNETEDNHLKDLLLHSEKERAENLMIVDLVRNDLAHSSKTGSVKVDQLFGIYSFKQVHQMISTVSSTISENMDVVDAIKNAFPMGSMTGAPKVIAMEFIEHYEATKRGLYSGAVGYFAPNGNFDFNVVIRSIQYNKTNKYLSLMVGGAITFDSIATNEYDECLLKAKATMQVLQ
jgi:para-aminobenzoate synthetase component 1